MQQPRPRVVLVGPPASGKTRIGRRVAALLGVDFVDTDHRISARYGPIPEIFAQHGEAHFRELERQAVQDALGTTGVVSLGGGAVGNEQTRKDLADQRVAQVSISPDAVARRLDNNKRPLLSGGLPSWIALVESRQAWYDEVSDATFDTSHRDTEHVALEVASWVEQEER